MIILAGTKHRKSGAGNLQATKTAGRKARRNGENKTKIP